MADQVTQFSKRDLQSGIDAAKRGTLTGTDLVELLRMGEDEYAEADFSPADIGAKIPQS